MPLSTRMPPLAPNARPAAWARRLSGRTPMAMITMPLTSSLPSLRVRCNPASHGMIACNAVCRRRSTALARSVSCNGTAISPSTGIITCVPISNNVTARPRRRNASVTSKPIKPPPTTVACFTVWLAMWARMASISSMLRSANTPGLSIPGKGGSSGAAPVLNKRRS